MTQKSNDLFYQKQMRVLAGAAGKKNRVDSFYWVKSKIPQIFIDDMRVITSDVTNLVFQKDAQYITVSYTLGGETVKKVYDFYVQDYKKLTLENTIFLTAEFFDLFMKKLGISTEERIVKPKIITPKDKIEQKIEANVIYSNKIKSEIGALKEILDKAQKAFEHEEDDVFKVKLSSQIEQSINFIKIREEILIREEKKVKDILENHESLEKKLKDEEFVERERLLKEMEMSTQETPYLQAVKTI